MRRGLNTRERMQSRISRGVGLFLLLVVSVSTQAQLPTATILGIIRDGSGAVVPGASLTARNVETGQTRTSATAEDGSYRFSALPVGNYEVRVEHPGFQSAVRSGLTLTVAQEAVVNVTLEVGAVEQTVALTAEAPLVNTTSGSLGGLVDAARVSDLPLNGRNFTDLTLLQTGITQQKNKPEHVFMVGSWYSSNGAPLRSNNQLLDGAIMQDLNGASSASYSGATLGVEGIREYRVITNNFSAEYGMTMGSQTTMVSKSGTNEFHGSLFEYFRNSALDARNFFDYKTAASQRRIPAFTRNNFGGSFGGPLRKEKTFFFGAVEEVRERLGVTSIGNGMPLSARGDGGVVPQIAPVIKPLLRMFPAPNLPNNQFTIPSDQRTSDHWGQMRVDQNISDSDSVFVRYTIHDENQTTPSTTMEDVTRFASSRRQYATLSETHIFSPTLLNTARVSFSRTLTGHFLDYPSYLLGPEYVLVSSPINNPPASISPGGGITGVGIQYDGQNGPQNLWTLSDDLFYTRGRHSLKFGTLLNFYRPFFTLGVGQGGSVSFADLTRFLLGQPLSIGGDLGGVPQVRRYRYKTFGFYLQDDVRVTPSFTLNLGLRYEFYTVPYELTGKNNSLRDIQHDVEMTPGPILRNPSLRNFSPRFGFAWDVRGDGKTAVRGGFGLLYDVGNIGSALVQDATGKPPWNKQSQLSNPPPLTSLPLRLPPENVGKYQRPIDYNYSQPHNLQFNLTVQRQLPFDMALTLAYSGARGLNLSQVYEGNPTVPQTLPDGRHFWAGNELRTNPFWDTFTLETAGGSSWYNGLQVELLKRLTEGLQFQSSYTWSKVMVTPGEAQYNIEATGTGIFSPDPSRPWEFIGPSNFDLTHNWRFNAIYNFPNVVSQGGVFAGLLNGWWTSGILALQSGYPFTPALLVNRSRSRSGGPGTNVDRPNLLPGYQYGDLTQGTIPTGCGNLAAGTPVGTPQRWFNPCAFGIPDPGFLGNVGSNVLRGPGFATLDMSVGKNVPLGFLGEAGKLEFRAEGFNLLNRANFGLPNRTAFTALQNVESPLATAGRINRTISTSRQLQFALKILF